MANPTYRYFVQFPYAPSSWQEINENEYLVMEHCMGFSKPESPQPEGVRLVAVPADLVPERPSSAPTLAAMFTLLTLPPPTFPLS